MGMVNDVSVGVNFYLTEEGDFMNKIIFIGLNVLFMAVVFGAIGAGIYYTTYRDYNRTGIVTCTDGANNTMQLTFEDLRFHQPGAFSFYSSRVEKTVKIVNMDCALVYDER